MTKFLVGLTLAYATIYVWGKWGKPWMRWFFTRVTY